MKHILLLAFSVLVLSNASAQQAAPKPFSEVWQESYQQAMPEAQSLAAMDEATSIPGEKSRFLGVVYSLILPGMGELYADKFERGHLPLIAEGFLWLGFAWFESYGGWIEDEALAFATQHAGANFAGKSDNFQVDIENFNDVYAYNNFKLVNRDLNALYPTSETEGYYWKWDNTENRNKFEQMRIRSDEMYNATSFVVLGLIANRIWSAIKASLAVRDYNNELRAGQSGLLPEMRTRITTFNGAADGLEFQFVQRF